MSLSVLDYVVVAAYLVAITAFGSWFARFQKTTRDYFLTDRTVPWWAICFTIVATETSTLTFIGIPASAYASFRTTVIDERNRKMHDAALTHVEKGGAFIAVGALHLPGKTGLIELFRRSGYTATPIE